MKSWQSPGMRKNSPANLIKENRADTLSARFLLKESQVGAPESKSAHSLIRLTETPERFPKPRNSYLAYKQAQPRIETS
ncbi:hypothetical protein CMUST_13565 [Corynebacterium mustelae]|uniref:Uncharacterized protein n=1 Tax=Corynebacterium mustelae TaxID=571915 RepID=A0A0G3H766_9CORY|nr:hypothetical protein CMUST_13565 [Corynebacterium mustelae]